MCGGFGKVLVRGDTVFCSSGSSRCVVKSERICKQRHDVGTAADPDDSRYALLASFRTKFRDNNFVVRFYVLLFIFSFQNLISKFTAVIIVRKFRGDGW